MELTINYKTKYSMDELLAQGKCNLVVSSWLTLNNVAYLQSVKYEAVLVGDQVEIRECQSKEY